MNKKGNVFVMGFIALTLGALLLGALALPQASTLYSTQKLGETLTLSTTPATTTQDLSAVTIVFNSSVTLPATNYTSDATANTVTLLDTVKVGNNTAFTVEYSYFDARYLDSASERTLAGVIGLALLIGLVFAGFQMFGLA